MGLVIDARADARRCVSSGWWRRRHERPEARLIFLSGGYDTHTRDGTMGRHVVRVVRSVLR